jgi:hypothetical protein
MPHYRSEYRRLCRAALARTPALAGCTILPVWPGAISDEMLPVIGVLTPQEPSAQDTKTSTTKRTLLQIALRRLGGDEIEDQLDQDSAVIELVILGALRSRDLRCVLEDTSIVSNTSAAKFVGTLVMSFRLQSWRSDPPLA